MSAFLVLIRSQWNGFLKLKNNLMHSQITYNCSIWHKRDWIGTRFRTFLFRKFVPDKGEEANNTMKNQRQDLLILRVCSGCSPTGTGTSVNTASVIFINIIIVSCGFYLPMDRRGHGVFGPHLAGWYDHAHFPHSGSGGDHKGRSALLVILIFASLSFYQPLIIPSQRLLNILIDSLPLIFQHKII